MNADAADLYDASGRLLPVKEWPEVWRRGLVTTIRTTRLYGRGENRSERSAFRQMSSSRWTRMLRAGWNSWASIYEFNGFNERVTVGLAWSEPDQ